MKLIIDIPEENYKLICSDGRPFLPSYKWIKNGIPLDDELDKIRAEIDSHCSVNRDRNDGLYIAMQIIDKYRKGEQGC